MDLKTVKSKLDGNTLDLSLSELTDVPVKEISQIKKAVNLDLSINNLSILPDAFAPQLSHLVILNLSKNNLTSLPENFGRLSHLQHLDVYKNDLKTLPISFRTLKSLKWMDIKDNPLEPQLREICGDCLDDKQCQAAAKRVVNHMQKLDAAHEREKQKQLKEERAKQAAIDAVRDKEARLAAEEKKKAKQAKKLAHKQKAKLRATHSDASSKSRGTDDESAGDTGSRDQDDEYVDNRGCCSKLFSFLMTFTLLLVLMASALAVGTVWVCSLPDPLFANQPAYCQAAYLTLLDVRSLKAPAFLKSATAWTREQVRHAPEWIRYPLDADYSDLSTKATDFGRRAVKHSRDLTAYLAEKLTIVGNAAFEAMVHGWDHVQRNYPVWKKQARGYWDYAVEHYPEWWATVKHHTYVTITVVLEYSLMAMEWIKDTTVDLYNNAPQYWEKTKYYWRNMK